MKWYYWNDMSYVLPDKTILYFGSTRIWTQSFTLSRQLLYCLEHVSILFCSSYFGDRVSLFGQDGPEQDSPILSFLLPAGITDTHHCTQLFSIEMGSCSRLIWNHDSLILCFLNSLGCQVCTTAPRYLLRCSLVISLPEMDLKSQFSWSQPP
jgi:hypothetical protein